MTDARDDYMRRQEADHDLLRMRTRTPTQPRPLNDRELDFLHGYMKPVRDARR